MTPPPPPPVAPEAVLAMPPPPPPPPYNPELVPVPHQLRMIGSDGSSYTVQPSVLLPQVLGTAVTSSSASSAFVSGQSSVAASVVAASGSAPAPVVPDLMDKLKSIQIPSNLDLGEILKSVREKTQAQQPPQQAQVVDAGGVSLQAKGKARSSFLIEL